MVEPDRGEPSMPALLADLNALGVLLMAIVEHDLYPARRTSATDRHPHQPLLSPLRAEYRANLTRFEGRFDDAAMFDAVAALLEAKAKPLNPDDDRPDQHVHVRAATVTLGRNRHVWTTRFRTGDETECLPGSPALLVPAGHGRPAGMAPAAARSTPPPSPLFWLASVDNRPGEGWHRPGGVRPGGRERRR